MKFTDKSLGAMYWFGNGLDHIKNCMNVHGVERRRLPSVITEDLAQKIDEKMKDNTGFKMLLCDMSFLKNPEHKSYGRDFKLRVPNMRFHSH